MPDRTSSGPDGASSVPDGASETPDGQRSSSTHSRGRGQSELVGFITVFSVAILVIIVVLATGFGGLDTAQEFQRTTSAEQGFTALASDIDDIVYRGAPSRTTEIGLTDARLSVAETESIAVSNESGAELARIDIHPITYDSGAGTTLTYYSGALVRADDGSPVMLREPEFTLDDGTLLLPIVRTTPEGRAVVGGRTKANLLTRQDRTERLHSNAPVENVTLNVSTPNVDAWERYFEGFENATVLDTGQAGHVEARIEADRLYVVETHVQVSIR